MKSLFVCFRVLCLVTPASLLTVVAMGDEAAPTLKVKEAPFAVRVTLKGIFESENMTEVVLRPEEWRELNVLEAVKPGTQVRTGTQLVRLETEAIDKAIADLESKLSVSTLALTQAEEEVTLLEKSLPLDLARAKQAMERADQDLLRFLKVDRPLSEKSAESNLKNARNFLEYEQEELRQLQKMYEADDLTEETEEIILRRQRDTVERLKFSVQSAQTVYDRTLQVELPRREEDLKERARKQGLEWDKLQTTLPLSLKQKQLELEVKKRENAQESDKLAKLRRDRSLMNLKSPADGVVYYGQCVNGRWSDFAATATKLRRGGRLAANEVIMTIVNTARLRIRGLVPENDLDNIQPGMKGTGIPTGYPDMKIPVAVHSVASIPSGSEGFDAQFLLESSEAVAPLTPGMTCTLEFLAYGKSEAIAVPADAIFKDILDSERQYVYVKTASGHDRRYVRCGKRGQDKVEILDGLDAGEEILTKRPEE